MRIGTVLTLFVVPAFYVLLGRYAGVPGAIEATLEQMQRDHPDEEQAADRPPALERPTRPAKARPGGLVEGPPSR